MDMVEVLSFLLMLSTMELGRVCLVSLRAKQAIDEDLDIMKEYSTENLSPTQSAMLADLSNYGLIWQHSVGIFTFRALLELLRADESVSLRLSQTHVDSVPHVWPLR